MCSENFDVPEKLAMRYCFHLAPVVAPNAMRVCVKLKFAPFTTREKPPANLFCQKDALPRNYDELKKIAKNNTRWY